MCVRVCLCITLHNCIYTCYKLLKCCTHSQEILLNLEILSKLKSTCCPHCSCEFIVSLASYIMITMRTDEAVRIGKDYSGSAE